MTLIAWQGGPIFRNGAVGTGQGCCCQQECVCPSGCVDGLRISLGNSPTCTTGFGSVIYRDTLSGGFVGCANNFMVIGWTVEMRCVDGVWTATIFGCGQNCNVRKTATLSLGSDCLPVAGVVDSSLFVDESPNNPACCPTPPTVTVTR